MSVEIDLWLVMNWSLGNGEEVTAEVLRRFDESGLRYGDGLPGSFDRIMPDGTHKIHQDGATPSDAGGRVERLLQTLLRPDTGWAAITFGFGASKANGLCKVPARPVVEGGRLMCISLPISVTYDTESAEAPLHAFFRSALLPLLDRERIVFGFADLEPAERDLELLARMREGVMPAFFAYNFYSPGFSRSLKIDTGLSPILARHMSVIAASPLGSVAWEFYPGSAELSAATPEKRFEKLMTKSQ